ncbi:ferrous iron transporter B [Aminivibrio sp.]|jgi:ferrous iron transport protein B|uniref:ferrous iron transporter B n=1 Tax=Aminivibrio sp. TaxID=1872489 RepID=UPI001A55AE6D|nr:ferrous iron transporter B [Aminivibrio sp.]MBL3539442.1 ferrous iron transporter B [Aminivibrio sp.]MDK2957989.1 ferrous iron transport protein [Synergistaceae bacterium]
MSETTAKKLLLVGNPNVGKSALFTRITGVHAVSSNYPGTTVGFLEGWLRRGDDVWRVIDVPGAYTLTPTNEAEEVAERMVAEGCHAVVLVLDATALERNLFLAFQIMERRLPVVIALNMVDEARHKGIDIDPALLEKLLGVPVVSTVAVSGEGISRLLDRLREASPGREVPSTKEERWAAIGAVTEQVQKVRHRHHTFLDKLEDASVNSFWGLVIGVAVITSSFIAIRYAGEGLIDGILAPLFERYWLPVVNYVSGFFGGTGFLHDIIVGRLVDGHVDFEQSFGMLTTGLYVPVVMVLPYVLSFYAVLSFLEDFGYLPRLAVIFDALLHRMGLHGFAIVPSLLGFGCNVPGILATRVLDSRRERFIAATLISVAIPCAGLQAMIIGALGGIGMKWVAMVYGTLLVSWLLLGRILHSLLPGFSPELIVEIPPYRIPSPKAMGLKLWIRISGFFLEAVPLVLGGILLISLMDAAGITDLLSRLLAPVFSGLLGLPTKAAGPILLGILRKDVAVGMLATLGLSPAQLVVATITLSMTFPCIATFIVLWRELGGKRMAASMGIMIASALIAGISVRLLLSLSV